MILAIEIFFKKYLKFCLYITNEILALFIKKNTYIPEHGLALKSNDYYILLYKKTPEND